MSNETMLEYARRYRAMWAEHDLDGIMALHDEDCELHVLGSEPVHGIDRIREVFDQLFTNFPDLRFEGRHLHAGDDHFVSEWTVRGSAGERVEMFGLEGDVTAGFECNGTDVFTVREGRITSKHTYWDTLAIARQAGSVPEPAAS